MKILHTSDLHLGHTLYSYDRTVEQTGCLAQIENIIKEQKPDAYVISGDVYHTTSPQTSAQEMFMHHLMTVHEIAPSMKVIVTAGNHDSNKIEITDPLWNLVGVSIVASIKRNIIQGEDSDEFHDELFERHIFPIGKDGSTVGYIVAIPHCYPGNFPAVKTGLPREERMKEFIALLLGEVEKRNKNRLPVVVMAHTAVNRISGEKPDAVGQDLDIIGGIDMVNADVFGTGYDYIALGHIHNPQNISDRIRYSGSPLPVSFDRVERKTPLPSMSQRRCNATTPYPVKRFCLPHFFKKHFNDNKHSSKHSDTPCDPDTRLAIHRQISGPSACNTRFHHTYFPIPHWFPLQRSKNHGAVSSVSRKIYCSLPLS